MGLAPNRVSFEVPLAAMTTFGLGGPAEALVEPETVDELLRILEYIRGRRLSWFILGGGSNVLAGDGGFAGVIVRLGKGFSGLRILERRDDRVYIEAGASAATAALLTLARREGLSGVEFLAGIPGWVGGALAMNAGGRDGSIIQAVDRLTLVVAGGRAEEWERGRLRAEYRRLDLPEGAVIVRAVLALTPDAPEAVEARVKDILDRRSATQPRGLRSAGCVFKNPAGDSAGRLIDAAGLKGRRVGSAWVAEEHANFIVHRGKATAAQVMKLIEEVRSEVDNRFGVRLEPEIRIIGRGLEKGSN